MSNKNLRVYRIQFFTQVKDMQFKVKFPCQIKMIWKRSNQIAETGLKNVQNGVVHFNQTLKMYINMYFDTTTNKFVEKKCMYSFLIITDKGEKSAGSVTYDLAEFFNKRIYQVQDEFPLQKCPLPDTKIKMKIYYEQSTQTGYDSMSRISTSSQLDISTASVDMHDFNEQSATTKVQKKTNSQMQQNKSKKSQSQTQTASKDISSQKQLQTDNYDLLNESDLGANIVRDNATDGSNSQKITENIQALNKITGKINDFVSRCSGNIKTQIQNLKHKNKNLQQSLSTAKYQIEKLQKQKQANSTSINELRKQLNDTKVKHELQYKKSKQQNEQLTHKLEQSQKLCQQMQHNLQEKGSSQSSYITQLKSNHQQNEKKLKQKLQTLNNQLLQQKTSKNQLLDKISSLQNNIKDLKQKLTQAQQKNYSNESKQTQRQKQLGDLRYRLENAYQEIVRSFGNLIQ